MTAPKRSVVLVLSLALLWAAAPPARAAVDPRTAQRIDEETEKIRVEIVKIRRFIHMNPELANREFETAKLVGGKLTSLGLEVKTGIAATGVVGLLRGGQPGPTVAVRADMDALPIQEQTTVAYKSLNPGIMHACGHDVHTAVALGTAMVLRRCQDRLRGSVKFIFQPAEEGPPEGEEGGAPAMIRDGVLEDPAVTAIFGFHVWPAPVGEAWVAGGPVMAGADEFTITVSGRSADAARPQDGVDAVVVAAQIVNALQTIVSRSVGPEDPAAITVGRIEGGVRPDLVASRAVLQGSVRTLGEESRRRIPQMIESMARHIAESNGATAAFELRPKGPALVNNGELVEVMRPTLQRVLGRDKVLPWSPQLMSEDFAWYGLKAPAFYFALGSKGAGPAAPLHGAAFNPDERTIPLGIRLLCNLLLDALDRQNADSEPPGSALPAE